MFSKPRRLLPLLFVVILCLGGTGAWAADALTLPNQVVRVGFPLQGGLGQKDAFGNYSGYTYEYLQEIAQYTGWEYEFVEIPGDLNTSLQTMLDMLSSGELDIMGAMNRNSALEALYDYPEYEYGLSYTTLGVPEENTFINEVNFATIPGLRIALLASSSRTRDKVSAFCDAYNIDYTFVNCENKEDMLAQVHDGRADVIVDTDLVPTKGIRTIAQMGGSPFYFAVSKGKTSIVTELNRAILTIRQTKPYFESTLYSKYFSNHSSQLYFSEQENDYLRSAPILRIAIVDGLSPIQSIGPQGEAEGIVRDLLDIVTEKTGLAFEYHAVQSYEEAFSLLADGQVDAVSGIPYDYTLAQRHNLVLCNSFLETPLAVVTRDGSGTQTVGLVRGMQHTDFETLPLAVLYNRMTDCLDAVASGEVDSAWVNLYSAEQLTQLERYRSLRLIPGTDKTASFCIGIKRPANPYLISILSKSFSHLSVTGLDAIIYQNAVRQTSQMTFPDLIRENPFLFIGLLSSIFAIIVCVSLLMLGQRNRANQRLALENRRFLQLCALANEYIYEYDHRRDTLTFSKPFAQLFSLPNQIPSFSSVVKGHTDSPSGLQPDLFSILSSLTQPAHGEDTDEHLCMLPGGERRWFRDTRADIATEGGKPIYVIGKLSDVQNEKVEKERLRQQAELDGLTGLYHTLSFRQLVDERLKANHKTGALLMMDIDHFKEINDGLGHYMGDHVLEELALLLRNTMNENDLCGRIGGDEFAIFASSISTKEQLSKLCEELCNEARKAYRNDEGVLRHVSISIGAAMTYGGCSFTGLYRIADKALYQTKHNGRNGYTIVSASMEMVPPVGADRK